MILAFGCDHAAYSHREKLIASLKGAGHTVIDCGCTTAQSCDYPVHARQVAEAVASGKAERGILVCGTGIGMSIAANKVNGIRAGVCWNDAVAALISEHNSANIICLPARFSSVDDMVRWIGIWLKTPASSEPRHQNRVQQIMDLENKC